MSHPRISFKTRIEFDEKDYHKRYAGASVSIGYRGEKLHHSERVTITVLSYYHELGDPLNRYPARPFILQSIRGVKGVERIQRYMGRKNATLDGLNRLVKRIVKDCKDFVKSGGVEPPLKLSTIKRKTQNNTIPLVETGELIEHLDGWVTRWKK